MEISSGQDMERTFVLLIGSSAASMVMTELQRSLQLVIYPKKVRNKAQKRAVKAELRIREGIEAN